MMSRWKTTTIATLCVSVAVLTQAAPVAVRLTQFNIQSLTAQTAVQAALISLSLHKQNPSVAPSPSPLSQNCPSCGGTGRTPDGIDTCPTCKGTGRRKGSGSPQSSLGVPPPPPESNWIQHPNKEIGPPPTPVSEMPPDVPAPSTNHRIHVYTPTWCGACPEAKKAMALIKGFDFFFDDDEPNFPGWVKQIGTYPLLHFSIDGGRSGKHWVWAGTDNFEKMVRPLFGPGKKKAKPVQAGAAMAMTAPTGHGHWTGPSGHQMHSAAEARAHLSGPPHYQDPQYLKSLDFQQLLNLHDRLHEGRTALAMPAPRTRRSSPQRARMNSSGSCPNCPRNT